MTQNYVINSITRELIRDLLSSPEYEMHAICSKHVQRALAIGIEHFHIEMEEIVAMELTGKEVGRYKSVGEAGEKLGIHIGSISEVMSGKRHSAGGFIFMKAREYELIPREKTA